jgi:Domain of unknown function (DUF1844)
MDEQPQHDAPNAGQISFIGFVISLASTAAVHFGDVENPVSGAKGQPDLPAAKQMIDILTLLEQKTKGNLTAEERTVLEQVLYELRLRFVQAATAEKRSQP